MTAPDRTFMRASLRRLGLLIGLLAIIAGIFGMHVMTGTHSGHSPAAVLGIAPAAQTGTAAPGSHGLHPVSHLTGIGKPAGLGDTAGALEQGHSCFGSGAGVHAMTGSCIPSARTGSLSARPPAAAGFGLISPATAAGAAPGVQCYHPGTPSPGELSVSRT